MTFYSQNGWTALHMASQEGQFDVVHVLIEASAHVNQQSKVLQRVHVECSHTSSVLFPLLLCLLPFFLIAHPFNLSPTYPTTLPTFLLPPSLLISLSSSFQPSPFPLSSLLRPGIGRNVSCALGDCLTSRPKGRSRPRELWFSIYSCSSVGLTVFEVTTMLLYTYSMAIQPCMWHHILVVVLLLLLSSIPSSLLLYSFHPTTPSLSLHVERER